MHTCTVQDGVFCLQILLAWSLRHIWSHVFNEFISRVTWEKYRCSNGFAVSWIRISIRNWHLTYSWFTDIDTLTLCLSQISLEKKALAFSRKKREREHSKAKQIFSTWWTMDFLLQMFDVHSWCYSMRASKTAQMEWQISSKSSRNMLWLT